MRTRPALVITAASLLAVAGGALAQPSTPSTPAAAAKETPAGRLSLITDRVVVFKDGYALIVKSATATADAAGHVYTEDVPDSAVLGSFWALADQGQIRSMRAEWVEEKKERTTTTDCLTMVELLRANKGRGATLQLNWSDKASISGTIADVLDLPPQDADETGATPPPEGGVNSAARFRAPPGAHPHPSPGPRGETVREITSRGGQFVAIDTEDGAAGKAGRIVLPVEQVRTISGPGLVTTMQRHEQVVTRAKRLTFDLDQATAGKTVRINILYFTPGVRWIPTYRVAGGGTGDLKDSAEVSLQAELLNELEDIDGAALDLVVGVPSFRFRSTISPMSLEATMRNALLQAAPNLMGQQQMSNALFAQRAGEWRDEQSNAAAEGPAGVNLAPELAASGEQDLFVYSAPRLSLPKGARATAPLWSSTAPIKHLYTMDVNVVRNPRGEGAADYFCYDAKSAALSGRSPTGSPPSPLRLAQQPVWHQLELTNNSEVPWTTGPAMLLKGTVPLGQDLLTYTSPKGTALLPVTVAMDVRGTYTEEEIERKPNALHWNNSNYALIRKRATITITNSRKETSDTRLTVSLGGRAENASDKGAIKINDLHTEDWGNSGNYLPNNHSDITWSVSLEPGQSKTFTVEFIFYVP